MIISENFKSLWIENYGYIQVGTDGTIIGKKGVLKPNNQSGFIPDIHGKKFLTRIKNMKTMK